MRVKLRELKPNPMRDFAIDPLDEEIIERLRDSIREHGFWGGVVGRQQNGHIEIAAGHHRVEAAIREGVEEGEIHVAGAVDDRSMIRLYAQENATQRGAAHSTARAGSVAAALRQVAYEDFVSASEATAEISAVAAPHTLRHGIGYRQVYEYLRGVNGIKEATVQTDLASLKASGDYARILGEARDQVDAEHQEAERQAAAARAAAERAQAEAEREAVEKMACEKEATAARAKRAAERAQKEAGKAQIQAVTFDFRGVAAHLKTAHHLREFRDIVTDETVRPYIPVDQQAVLAERLLQRATVTGEEVTGHYIRTHVGDLAAQLRRPQNELERLERERFLAADWRRQLEDLVFHYGGALRNVAHYGDKLLKHLEKTSADGIRPVSGSLAANVARALEVIAQVKEGLK